MRVQQIYTCRDTYTRLGLNMFNDVCVYVYMHEYIYTYMIYIYIHTHTYVQRLGMNMSDDLLEIAGVICI